MQIWLQTTVHATLFTNEPKQILINCHFVRIWFLVKGFPAIDVHDTVECKQTGE